MSRFHYRNKEKKSFKYLDQIKKIIVNKIIMNIFQQKITPVPKILENVFQESAEPLFPPLDSKI